MDPQRTWTQRWALMQVARMDLVEHGLKITMFMGQIIYKWYIMSTPDE